MKIRWDHDFWHRIHKNIARTQNELNRFYELPPRFKARTLLEYAYAAKSELSEFFDKNRDTTREDSYRYDLTNVIIPGLAYRLGETRLNADQMNAIGDFPREPQNIRNLVSAYIKNTNILHSGMNPDQAVVTQFLEHDFVNGNVITIAMDELAPPVSESNDWIATHMREISHARFGHEKYDAWCPEFQNYERSNFMTDAMTP